jgi:serine/threonine protein phosphatase PrpC
MLGHEVSGYLRENLPINMNNELKRKNKNVNIHNVNNILTEIFVDTNNKLLSGEIVDTTFSGSTCVSLIFTPEKVITANVGDSRAVLGKFKDGGKYINKIFYYIKIFNNKFQNGNLMIYQGIISLMIQKNLKE